MRTVRFANCLFGAGHEGLTTIYAPKTSSCLSVPIPQISRLLEAGLRDKPLAIDEIMELLRTSSDSVTNALDCIGFLLQHGVLVEAEAAPRWEDLPFPDEVCPVDVLLLVANYPFAGDVPTPVPFGVMCVASSLRARGMSVAIVDMALARLEAWRVVSSLRRYRPKVVGISAITAAGKEAERVARWIRQWATIENSDFRGIVLGGHHATDFTELAGASGCFDVLLTGKQAFATAPDVFLGVLRSRRADISGAFWYEDGECVEGRPAEWRSDLKVRFNGQI